jgi:WXG100 family type VII secretion target
MSLIKVTSADLVRTSVQLTAGASRIADENAVALGAVEGLTAGSWAGAASTEFAQYFLRWKTAADEIQASLSGIATLLDSAASEYQTTEDAINASFT